MSDTNTAMISAATFFESLPARRFIDGDLNIYENPQKLRTNFESSFHYVIEHRMLFKLEKVHVYIASKSAEYLEGKKSTIALSLRSYGKNRTMHAILDASASIDAFTWCFNLGVPFTVLTTTTADAIYIKRRCVGTVGRCARNGAGFAVIALCNCKKRRPRGRGKVIPSDWAWQRRRIEISKKLHAFYSGHFYSPNNKFKENSLLPLWTIQFPVN